MIKLRKLLSPLPEIEVKGTKDLEITGITAHSKSVAPGNLFVAKRGETYDGHQFITEAVAAGAVAVLTDLADPFLEITQLIHPETEKMGTLLAAEYHHHPSKKLKVVGVTGTNGKTTTTYLIKHLLDQKNFLTGLIGSIDWVVGNNRYPSKMTCPDPITGQKLLHEMVDAGCSAVAMEASSHGLDQKRCEGIHFDAAVFTNLSQDHLDYHKTMDAYLEAKTKLFTSLSPGQKGILNRDDPVYDRLSPKVGGDLFTYGIDACADLMAKDLKITPKGVGFTASYLGNEMRFQSTMRGRFNIYNLLAAISVGLCFGFSLEEMAPLLRRVPSIPGRLEPVKNKLGLHIFVDFAHTPDALSSVLQALREEKKGKLITLFGCGGERDQDKRAKMGAVVSQFSDEAVVTSDNPRGEDPELITRDILKGLAPSLSFEVELDRRRAIEKAIKRGESGDTILIAGRGHESVQLVEGRAIPFSDADVASEICTSQELISR